MFNFLSMDGTGVVGGKYGIGIVGFSYEYRQSIGDAFEGDLIGDVRVSGSFFGARVRVTYGEEGAKLDLGLGGTVGFGSGVSLFGGGRISSEGASILGSASGVLAPGLIGPLGVGASGEVVTTSVAIVGSNHTLSSNYADILSQNPDGTLNREVHSVIGRQGDEILVHQSIVYSDGTRMQQTVGVHEDAIVGYFDDQRAIDVSGSSSSAIAHNSEYVVEPCVIGSADHMRWGKMTLLDRI